MNEVQSCFVKYVGRYVKALTKGKDEYFLSLCDIEEEVLEGLDVSELTDFQVAVVSPRDYSAAVRLRNDTETGRIVLLSGEGVKQIDSLKDFNEYSVLCRDREILWQCLEHVLNLRGKISAEVRTFLEEVLDAGEVSFFDLLSYLLESIDKNMTRLVCIENGKRIMKGYRESHFLSVKKLNRNLPLLGIWRSNDGAVPGKGKIRRMIRTSRYTVLENRLTKAVMNHEGLTEEQERLVTACLARGEVEKILRGLYYEEIEGLLKNAGRGRGKKSGEDTSTVESLYVCSFEYLLMEQVGEEPEEAERRLKEERDQEEEAQSPILWGKYDRSEHDREEIKAQFKQLAAAIGQMNLPREKINMLEGKLSDLEEAFFGAWEKVWENTPVCLDGFCRAAAEYTDKYLKLMAEFLVEDRNRYAMCGMKIVELLEGLFCRKTARGIRMPFYHPVCVFYYSGIRMMYLKVLAEGRAGDTEGLKLRVQNAVIRKLEMNFPVEFLQVGGKVFALDHASLGYPNNRADGQDSEAGWHQWVEFPDMEAGAVYSVSDFRLVSRQITDYLISHPLLTQITVSLVDIGNLGGLVQLVDRIRCLSQSERCNIGRVDFLILSAREEELKREMSQIWDAAGGSGKVRFRFSRRDYWAGGRYDMERIFRDSDLTVIADCSTLYHEPRQVKERKAYNIVRGSVEKMELQRQLEQYLLDGVSELPLMWDTLQHAAVNREEGFFRWRGQELDNGLLGMINRRIEEEPEKSVLLLSSEDRVLSEIFRTDYVHAHRRKYNGKNMTLISFDSRNASRQLPEDGELKLSCSLKDFYHMALDLNQIQKELHPELEDVKLEIRYEKGQFYCRCVAVGETAAELEEEWRDRCGEWVAWHMEEFPFRDDLMGRYFRELSMDYWREKTESLSAILLAEKLASPVTLKLKFAALESTQEDYLTGREADCLEAVKIHEMLRFAVSGAVMDEQMVRQFTEQFEEEMLNRVLQCDDAYGRILLGKAERERLDRISWE